MSSGTQNVVITQANGEQGATSYGPRLRNKASASHHGNQDLIRTVEIQLDASVQTEQVFDPLNDTQNALPEGSLLLDVFAYSSTGVAALSLGVQDEVNGGPGNVYVGPLAGKAWTVQRDLDIQIGRCSQFIFSGLGPTAGNGAPEVATVYLTFLQTATDGGEDGVLEKPRVVPAP